MHAITLISAFLILLQIANCNQDKPSIDPCFTDRKITEQIKEAKMECISVNDDMIILKSETGRYSVCNAEGKSIIKGEEYLISGQCFETLPNERWPGTPFQIIQLKAKN